MTNYCKIEEDMFVVPCKGLFDIMVTSCGSNNRQGIYSKTLSDMKTHKATRGGL